MTKKLCWILLLILGGILLSPTVKAEQFYEGNYIPNLWVNKEKDGRIRYQQARFLNRKSDGKFAYCIEPWETISNSAQYENGVNVLMLTDDQLQKMALTAYYGFYYPGHVDPTWYYATQLLIWKIADPEADFYFTDQLKGQRINDYDKQLEEIRTLVSNHDQVPNFGTRQTTMVLGEKKALTDLAQQLGNFTLENNPENASIEGNQLVIHAIKEGMQILELSKNDSLYGIPPLVYKSNDYQDFLTVGSYSPVKIHFEVEVMSGQITIEKKEMSTHSPESFTTLFDSKFKITDSQGKITFLTLDGKPEKTLDHLPIGTYTIEEIEAGEGYQINHEPQIVTIDDSKLNHHITFYNKKVEKKIIIQKYFGREDSWQVEPEIEFELYTTDDILLKTAKTDQKGQIELTLPYGKYRLHQKTIKANYTTVEDQTIEVYDEKEEKLELYNHEITGKLIVHKLDQQTKTPIIATSAQFKLKNLDTGLWLPETFQTDGNGRLEIGPLSFGTYQLVEIDAPKNYQLAEQAFFFTIDQDHLEITLEVENERIIEVPDTEIEMKGLIYDNNDRKKKYFTLDAVSSDRKHANCSKSRNKKCRNTMVRSTYSKRKYQRRYHYDPENKPRRTTL